MLSLRALWRSIASVTSASDFFMKQPKPTTSSTVASLTSTFLGWNLFNDLVYSPVAGHSLGGSLSLYCDGCLRTSFILNSWSLLTGPVRVTCTLIGLYWKLPLVLLDAPLLL